MEIPQQEYGVIGPRDWDDRPCYVIGGGASLIPHQAKLWNLHTKGRTIAVNDAYKRTNVPDLIISLDHLWLEKNLSQIKWMSAPVICAVDEGNPRTFSSNLTYVKRLYRGHGINDHGKLSDDPGKIVNGMNSGHMGLQVAWLKGSKIIYLLGFDFKEIGEKRHFHDGYEYFEPGYDKRARDNAQRLYPLWAETFKDTLPQLRAAGVQVFNCSPDSLLTAFPHKSYEEVL